MASSYFISCTNLETKLSEHFKVPHSIYVYVKQLECQIYKLKKENCNEGDKTMSVLKEIKNAVTTRPVYKTRGGKIMRADQTYPCILKENVTSTDVVTEIKVPTYEKYNEICGYEPIKNVSRAPERRIFYIDVGNLPKMKAEQYLKDIMTKYKNKVVYDE